MNIDKIEKKVEQIEHKYNEKTKNIEDKINSMENDLDRQTYTTLIAGYATTKYVLKGTIKGIKAKRHGNKFLEEFKKNCNEDIIEEDVEKTFDKLVKLRKKQNPVNIARKPLNLLKKVINLAKNIIKKKGKQKLLEDSRQLYEEKSKNKREGFIEEIKIGDNIKENLTKTTQEYNNRQKEQVEEEIYYGKE